MKPPRVSVIMPVYNAEKYLRETIDSILNQNFIDFEFLIIDDGSTDKSLQILNSYTDPRIKVSKNPKNIGYVRTLNILIELAKGEYIARQDNDDISFPKRLQMQVDFLDKNMDVGVCGTNALIFGNKKKRTLMPIGNESIKIFMLISNPIIHPTVMLRSALFNDLTIPKYDESLCPSEDYAMWFEISKRTRLANLPEPLLKYRLHANNTSVLKKNIQIEKANQVRKRIIEYNLSYKITEEELMLLNLISYPELINSKSINSLEHLLIRLLQANEPIGIYNRNALKNIFFYYWTKSCFKSKNINVFNKFRIYILSSLFSLKCILTLISKIYITKFIYDKNN